MSRTLTKIVLLLALTVSGAVGLYFFYDSYSTARRLRKLEEEKRQLEQIVQRLSAERRVAEILVTDQKTLAGVPQTTLLFVEYARNQSPLPAKSFTFKGRMAHVDAMVVKFERDFVKQDDPLRGHSIALFTRIFGDHERPEDASPIDAPGQIPDVYRGADPRASQFERQLWQSFWRLADDDAYRAAMGVRIANGQGIWSPFEFGKLYTLSIESDGGLNLVCEPLKPIYREFLKQHPASQPLPR